MSYDLSGFIFGLGYAVVVTAIFVCVALISARREEARGRTLAETDRVLPGVPEKSNV